MTSAEAGPAPGRELTQVEMTHRLPPATCVDRIQYVCDQAAGRRVIHVGFADAGCRRMQHDTSSWLHEHLSRVARELVGVDVDVPGVDEARSAGFEANVLDCRDADAVRVLDLEPADLVVAGEVIEHVDDPGGFLDGLHGLCAPGGRLLLTTPNAAGLGQSIVALGGFEVNHPDHVLAFTWRTLTRLLERHDWRLVDTKTFAPSVKETAGAPGTRRTVELAGRLFFGAERLLARVAPYAADGLIVVARPAPDRSAAPGSPGRPG